MTTFTTFWKNNYYPFGPGKLALPAIPTIVVGAAIVSVGIFLAVRHMRKSKKFGAPSPAFEVGDILQNKEGSHWTIISPDYISGWKTSEGEADTRYNAYPSDPEGYPDIDRLNRGTYIKSIDSYSINHDGLHEVGHTDKIKTVTKGKYSWGLSGVPGLDIRMAQHDGRWPLFYDNATKKMMSLFKRRENNNDHLKNSESVAKFAEDYIATEGTSKEFELGSDDDDIPEDALEESIQENMEKKRRRRLGLDDDDGSASNNASHPSTKGLQDSEEKESLSEPPEWMYEDRAPAGTSASDKAIERFGKAWSELSVEEKGKFSNLMAHRTKENSIRRLTGGLYPVWNLSTGN